MKSKKFYGIREENEWDNMRLLVTGGAGFIGSNFVRYIVKKHRDWDLTVIDKLTYAGNRENLKDVIEKITLVKGDICDRKTVEKLAKDIDCVVNFAAETHVDRSVVDADSFVLTNVFGTYVLLDICRKFDIERFMHISTDEVYGSILDGVFREDDRLSPRNPYAASKGSADLFCKAFFETYDLPVVISRSTNNYGPYQHPEKFIPKTIIYTLLNKSIPVYGKGENVRNWLYVEDNCEALEMILQKGKKGEIYNIAGNDEMTNVETLKTILKVLGKSESLIEFVKDRPAHDLRYALDAEKMKNMGWYPKTKFLDGIRKTIEWYRNNQAWWRPFLTENIDFHTKF
jgi:dTDP-glucose 4,6-dehydratase